MNLLSHDDFPIVGTRSGAASLEVERQLAAKAATKKKKAATKEKLKKKRAKRKRKKKEKKLRKKRAEALAKATKGMSPAETAQWTAALELSEEVAAAKAHDEEAAAEANVAFLAAAAEAADSALLVALVSTESATASADDATASVNSAVTAKAAEADAKAFAAAAAVAEAAALEAARATAAADATVAQNALEKEQNEQNLLKRRLARKRKRANKKKKKMKHEKELAYLKKAAVNNQLKMQRELEVPMQRELEVPPPPSKNVQVIQGEDGRTESLCELVENSGKGDCFVLAIQHALTLQGIEASTVAIRKAGVQCARNVLCGVRVCTKEMRLVFAQLQAKEPRTQLKWCKRMRKQGCYSDRNHMAGIAIHYGLDVRIVHRVDKLLVYTESMFGRAGATRVVVEFSGSFKNGHCRHCITLTPREVLRTNSARGAAATAASQSSPSADAGGFGAGGAASLGEHTCGSVRGHASPGSNAWCTCPGMQHRKGPQGVNAVMRLAGHLTKFSVNFPHLWEVLHSEGMQSYIKTCPTYTLKPFVRWLTISGQKVRPTVTSDGHTRTLEQEANVVFALLTTTGNWIAWGEAMVPADGHGSTVTTMSNHHWQVRCIACQLGTGNGSFYFNRSTQIAAAMKTACDTFSRSLKKRKDVHAQLYSAQQRKSANSSVQSFDSPALCIAKLMSRLVLLTFALVNWATKAGVAVSHTVTDYIYCLPAVMRQLITDSYNPYQEKDCGAGAQSPPSARIASAPLPLLICPTLALPPTCAVPRGLSRRPFPPLLTHIQKPSLSNRRAPRVTTRRSLPLPWQRTTSMCAFPLRRCSSRSSSSWQRALRRAVCTVMLCRG